MKRLTHGVSALPHSKGGVLVTKWQIVVLKNVIHIFGNITQIDIQGQNKACAIVHPQLFCIPEEQTLIYSYLIAFFEYHGWSW